MNKEMMTRTMSMMGGGCGLFLISGAVSCTSFYSASTGAGILGAVGTLLGIGLFIWGLATALREGMGDDRARPEETVKGVYIVGKLILNGRFEQVYDPEMYDPEDLKLLIQVWIPGRGKEEMKAHPLVFNSIGEGMTGTLVFQGKWINQFIPQKDEEPQADAHPPDPFSNGQM